MTINYKDYEKWMNVKSTIQTYAVDAKDPIGYREGDIFWTSIGENVGFEEDGKGERYLRPVLIISGISRTLFLGAPLSTTSKNGKFYCHITVRGVPNIIMFNQIRVFDSSRIKGGKRLFHINKTELLRIKEALKNLI